MKKLKPALVLLLVFLAGGISGVVLARVVVRNFIRRAVGNPDFLRQKIERGMARKLDLDAQQRAKVDQTLTQVQSQIRDLRGEFQPRFQKILRDGQEEISAALTPEQRARFEKYREENLKYITGPR